MKEVADSVNDLGGAAVGSFDVVAFIGKTAAVAVAVAFIGKTVAVAVAVAFVRNNVSLASGGSNDVVASFGSNVAVAAALFVGFNSKSVAVDSVSTFAAFFTGKTGAEAGDSSADLNRLISAN